MTRTKLTIKQIIILLIIGLLGYSCSDPIFWVIQNEKEISTGNLGKRAAVNGMAYDGIYYYVVLGTQLFYKAADSNNDWQYIPTQTYASSVGGSGSNVKVATYGQGVWQLQNGQLGTQVSNANMAKILSNGSIVTTSGTGKVQVDSTGDYFGDIVGILGASTYVDVIGQNSNASGDGNVTGANGHYLVTNRFVGDNNNWGAKITMEGGRSIADVALLSGVNVGDALALVGSSGGGYFELYTKDGELAVRSPQSTVQDNVTYQTSDLAKAVVIGFFNGIGDEFFVLTANRGLWSNRSGEWKWE